MNGENLKMNVFKNIFNHSIIDLETRQWLFDTFAWALTHFGSDMFYEHTQLVTPTDTYFPDDISNISEAEIAEKLFYQVKHHAGMDGWHCQLQPQAPNVNPRVGYFAIQDTPLQPLGTFSMPTNQIKTVTYDPDLVYQPSALIATFAHELGHYLSYSADTPPGGEALYEPATDLLAVFMGFGLFMANSAFNFQQTKSAFTEGWQSQAQGYLNEQSLTYALAIFCVLKNIDNKVIETHLKKSLHRYFRRAVKDVLSSHTEIEYLREIVSLKKHDATVEKTHDSTQKQP